MSDMIPLDIVIVTTLSRYGKLTLGAIIEVATFLNLAIKSNLLLLYCVCHGLSSF